MDDAFGLNNLNFPFGLDRNTACKVNSDTFICICSDLI